MTNPNNFISNELLKVNEEAELIISSHINQLNHTSNDIKVLESKLKKAGIPFSFVYVLVRVNRQSSHPAEYGFADPDHSIPTSSCFEEFEEHCLVWGSTPDGDCRLSYNIYSFEDEHIIRYYRDGEEQEVLNGEVTLKFSSPFINTKSNIRLKFKDELPNFYKKLTECLKKEWDKEIIVQHSLNYNGVISALSLRETGILFAQTTQVLI